MHPDYALIVARHVIELDELRAAVTRLTGVIESMLLLHPDLVYPNQEQLVTVLQEVRDMLTRADALVA